jgi:hypothetical protein
MRKLVLFAAWAAVVALAAAATGTAARTLQRRDH